jgi:hypothetical protein
MALKDYYDEADILESFSWIALPDKVRINKLAYLYIKEEGDIRRRSRGYYRPTKGTVGTFVKSLYRPPRGAIGPTTERVLWEIRAQKAKRTGREKNPQWAWPAPPSRSTARHAYSAWKSERMNRVSERRFGITESKYRDDEPKPTSHNCVGITTISNCLVIVDGGSWYSHPRVYIKDKMTGKEAVYVLGGDSRCASLIDALSRMAPKNVLRKLFDGATCRLSPEGGFDLDGKLIPFREIRKVYTGEDIKATAGKPKPR